jgi:hypothetical protein
MKFQKEIRVYGDQSFRGECPTETAEQITFFNIVRRDFPEVGKIATHIRNEGVRTHNQAARQKAEGMTVGASDIIVPGCPAFVCEMKRQDHTKSRWQDGQIEYLLQAQENGAFVCVALGYVAAIEALKDWLCIRTIKNG